MESIKYHWRKPYFDQKQNFVNLCSYLREKNVFDGPGMPILQKDGSIAFYSGGGLRRISKAEYEAYIADLKAGHTRKSPFSEDEWFFLMDTFIIEQKNSDSHYLFLFSLD